MVNLALDRTAFYLKTNPEKCRKSCKNMVWSKCSAVKFITHMWNNYE